MRQPWGRKGAAKSVPVWTAAIVYANRCSLIGSPMLQERLILAQHARASLKIQSKGDILMDVYASRRPQDEER